MNEQADIAADQGTPGEHGHAEGGVSPTKSTTSGSADVLGYMCKTDFEHEVRGASDGARVYPSEGAARRELKCINECGMVEVRLALVRVVQAENFSGLLESPGDGAS